MAGVDREAGGVLDGFAHVQQSLEVIFTTRQGERVMREWFGNPGLKLLGENATPQTVLQWFTTLWVLVEIFEPRFRITRFVVNDIDRLGFGDFTLEGEHRPYAHLDWTQAAAYVSVSDGNISIALAA